ncbi:hypothetical protein X975_18509, partial [Stegodyphus mimosarum]
MNSLIKKLVMYPNVSDSADAILNLVDVINERIHCLNVLEQRVEGFGDTYVTHLLVEKLDRIHAIGVNVFMSLVLGEPIKQNQELPTAVRSKLGWIISGTALVNSYGNACILLNNLELTTDEFIKKFWTLETVPEETVLSKSEEKCEEHFKTSHNRDDTGAASRTAAKNLIHDIDNLMRRGGFILRKWPSNMPDVLEGIPKELRENGLQLDIFKEQSRKITMKCLNVPASKCFARSDSTITLFWIASESRRWLLFVANRMSKIQTAIPEVNWNPVQGKNNPAYYGTRRLQPNELIECYQWFNGPSWLQNLYWMNKWNWTVKK